MSTPSQSHDQDLNEYSFSGANPYEEHGPYDTDYTAASRPPPIPYNDPYSDIYTATPSSELIQTSSGDSLKRRDVQSEKGPPSHHKNHGMERGHDRGKDNQQRDTRPTRGRGRGRGRRGWQDDRRAGIEMTSPRHGADDMSWPNQAQVERMVGPHVSWPLSPAGQYYDDGSAFTPPNSSIADTWPSHQLQQPYAIPPFGIDPHWHQHQYVQPHINPRFASAFGLNIVDSMQSEQYSPVEPNLSYYGQESSVPVRRHSVDEWMVPTDRSDAVKGDDRIGDVPAYQR